MHAEWQRRVEAVHTKYSKQHVLKLTVQKQGALGKRKRAGSLCFQYVNYSAAVALDLLLQPLRLHANALLNGFEPWQTALLAVVVTLLVVSAWQV